MDNKIISFVVLHYQSIATTIQCIDSLDKLDPIYQKNIVIVDNASPNESGIELLNKYNKEINKYVLLNGKNEGFAAGNNLGYRFAKDELNSDIIIVMNNDVIIHQSDFINRLLQISEKNRVEIIAPDIITLDNKHQNPYRIQPISTSEIFYIFILNIINYILYSLPVISDLFLRLNNSRPRIRKINEINHKISYENIIPHGACVIYTRYWIMNEDFAFLPKTFMYLEEYILFEYIKKKSYKTRYTPEIYVEHLEDVSTNEVAKTKLKKAHFKAKHALKSARSLLLIRLFSNF